MVTGASRGIGAAYVERLAKRGYDLILVARSEAPLKALTASLASESGRHITAIVADLNDEMDLAKVETRLKEDSSITMLVNNAGTCPEEIARAGMRSCSQCFDKHVWQNAIDPYPVFFACNSSLFF